MRKYTLYAFGEIALVVIGILIALRVSNWNQERLQNSERIAILHDLKKEFDQNQEALQEKLDAHKFVSDYTRLLSFKINPEYKEISGQTLDSFIYAMAYLPQYSPADGVINSIISTGGVGLIKNRNLKYKITSWKGMLDGYKLRAKLNYDYYMNFIYPFLQHHFQMKNVTNSFPIVNHFIPLSKFEYSKKAIMTSSVFENHAEMRRSNAELLYTSANELFQFQEELIGMLDSELK
jgi:hypothetical protein